MALLHLTGETFKNEVLDYEGVALVDFWAPWCGPCQMVGPVMEELSTEFDNAKVCKVNVDEEGALAQEYNIMSIPAVYVFKNGQIVETLIGVQAKETYRAAIQKYI